jgi:membrane protein DedA with SNARE-associated domain
MPSFLNAEWLISTFGVIGILVMVFAESGLLIGFFLPGDSLPIIAVIVVLSLIPVAGELLRARRQSKGTRLP